MKLMRMQSSMKTRRLVVKVMVIVKKSGLIRLVMMKMTRRRTKNG